MCALIGVLVAVGLLGCAAISVASVAWAAVVLLSFLGHSFVGFLKKARLGK